MASAASIRYAGEVRGQRPLHRFDFHAPLLASRHILTVHGKSATTGYSGSFWVDNESFDIVRLETEAEDIPADLDCRKEHESVTYGRLAVGERLIPTAGELTVVQRDSSVSHNTIAFSNCHHYTADSSLWFTKAPEITPHRQLQLPAGVVLVLGLEQPISISESAAGDQVVARLQKAIRVGSLSLAKGTPILGRVQRLEQHLSSPSSYLVGLQFFVAESTVGQITFNARLTGPRATPDVAAVSGVYGGKEIWPGNKGLDIEDDGVGSGVGTFRVYGKMLYLPRGFRTVWKTQ